MMFLTDISIKYGVFNVLAGKKMWIIRSAGQEVPMSTLWPQWWTTKQPSRKATKSNNKVGNNRGYKKSVASPTE